MGQARFLNDWHITARGQAGWGTVREFFRLASMERASPDAFLGDNSLVQSFSNAIHPFRRLTNSQVALFFRAEDGRIGLPVSAMMSRYYAGVHMALSPILADPDKNNCAEQMHDSHPSARIRPLDRSEVVRTVGCSCPDRPELGRLQ